MSSTPKFLQNPTLRSIQLPYGGPVATAERLGDQHYLIWINGTPVTEVQCIPSGSDRWYWRGSRLTWEHTRMKAIVNGRVRRMKNCTLDGKPLEAWSEKAQVAIGNSEQAQEARRFQIAIN